MAKISLNSHVNSLSGGSWTSQTINSIKYFVSQNKTSSSVSSIKCSFTTPYDNINVVVEIGSSSENNYDWCYVGKLDDSSADYNNYLDRISGLINNGPKFKPVTINVAKAGTHFLIIGYRKDGSGNVGNDCGYFRLITTEVEKQKNPYIYCGTKKILEPIKFSKDNDSNTGFSEYSGSDKRLQWVNKYAGNNSNNSSRISFTTTSDNIIVTLIYERYFNANGDKFVASSIDGSLTFTKNDYVYIAGPGKGVVTKEITVSKAGEHYIDIGYVLINSRSYIHVGFSGTNIILNAATPESILANNKDISEVYVGAELIWKKTNYLWANQQYLNNISFYKKSNGIGDKVTFGSKKYDKYVKDRTIIPGGTSDYTKTTYGFVVDDLIKNGYLFCNNYGNVSDMSAFPNPVDMYHRYSTQNGSHNIKFLKINPKINKETTSLLDAFEFMGHDNTDTFDEPLINRHKACNIIGLDKLNTYNITNMKEMFNGTRIVGNLDFSNWDTSKVTDMTYMFNNSNGSNKNYNGAKNDIENYSYLTGLNNWNLQSVTNMTYMFYNSKYYNFQDKELTWNTSNVTDMTYMFRNCNAYNFPKLSFDTRNVTNMSNMFENFNSYNGLNLNFTDTSKVTNMDHMFNKCEALNSLDVSKLNTSNVTNMYCMFQYCKSITNLDVSNWDVSKVKDMRQLFYFCEKLTSLDLSKWDISNVTNDTSYILYLCKELTTLIDGHESEPNITALNGLKKNLVLYNSTKLNYESVYALFRGAATVTTTQTITLPKVMEGKLDADKVKIATDKGWTIAYK